MLPVIPNLICLATADISATKDSRITAKVLAASVMRNLPVAEVKALRSAVAMAGGGLFKVEKAGLEEKFEGGWMKDEVAGNETRSPWEIVESLGDVRGYPWVLYLRGGSLVLRGVDHLLAAKADILWAPLPGVPVAGERCGGFLTEEERAEGFRPVHPASRPWREAASAAIWAVRGEFFAGVMAEWKAIYEQAPPEGGTPTVEGAWNRLLLDTPLPLARFERDEVQFPCLPGVDFLSWKDACILNVGDWPQDVQSKFLQAWFYGTYFADPTGLFLDIVEP